MRELPPDEVGRYKLLPVPRAADDNGDAAFSTETGRFSSCGEFAWVAKADKLNVFKTPSDQEPNLFGSLCFGKLLADPTVSIAAVKELLDPLPQPDPTGKPLLLVVVLNRPRSHHLGSIVCLVDPFISRVIRAIECPFRISTLSVVMLPETTDILTRHERLAPELSIMRGIVAVGAEGGLVVFIDLCLDLPSGFVLPPAKLTYIANHSNYDIRERRNIARLQGQHLGIQLNGNSQAKNRFYYRKPASDPGDSVLNNFSSKDVYVSAISYIHQLNTICIGFNFGCFQLWDMHQFTLINTCRYEPPVQPMIAFAFQEPESDPKFHSYIWMIRGSSNDESSDFTERTLTHIGPSVATLYSLIFEKREWLQDFGSFYSNFIDCTARFEYNLTSFPHIPSIENCVTSQLIACYTLTQGNPWAHRYTDDESLSDTSLLLLAWEASSETSESSSTFFAIFDINQYYQAQMPDRFETSKLINYSSYLGIYSLADVCSASFGEYTLDLRVDLDSISRFKHPETVHDLHYYPCGLSFNIKLVSESSTIEASYLSIQRRILKQLVSKGPDILINPHEALNDLITNGLCQEIPLKGAPVAELRRVLLNMMLEYGQTEFLLNVIAEWSTHSKPHLDCDCQFFLDWLWQRVSIVKSQIDDATVPLFNQTRDYLDNFVLKSLYTYEVDLNVFTLLIEALGKSPAANTERARQELQNRHEVLILLSTYLRTLLWFLKVGLLPERAEDAEPLNDLIAYPYSLLKSRYVQRRKELASISNQAKPTLLIDYLLESSPEITQLWSKVLECDGLYPPPTIHALLSNYLLDKVSFERKHQILLYFLMDIAEQYKGTPAIKTKLDDFSNAFRLPNAFQKFSKGIWALDNKKIELGLGMLLQPEPKTTYFLIEKDEDDEQTIKRKLALRHKVLQILSFHNRKAEAVQFASLTSDGLEAVPDDLKSEYLAQNSPFIRRYGGNAAAFNLPEPAHIATNGSPAKKVPLSTFRTPMADKLQLASTVSDLTPDLLKLLIPTPAKGSSQIKTSDTYANVNVQPAATPSILKVRPTRSISPTSVSSSFKPTYLRFEQDDSIEEEPANMEEESVVESTPEKSSPVPPPELSTPMRVTRSRSKTPSLPELAEEPASETKESAADKESAEVPTSTDKEQTASQESAGGDNLTLDIQSSSQASTKDDAEETSSVSPDGDRASNADDSSNYGDTTEGRERTPRRSGRIRNRKKK